MTNSDTELADKVISVGVGKRIDMEPPHSGTAWALFDDEIAFLTAESFVRDWRLAGALMAKCGNGFEYVLIVDEWEVQWYPDNGVKYVRNESLPRAIISACVEALSDA